MGDKNKSDEDLNDLLDSALQDFDKNSTKSDGKKSEAEHTAIDSQIGGAKADSNVDDPDVFFMEQAKIVAERMNSLFGKSDALTGEEPAISQDPDQIMSAFKKMAEAAAMTLQGENPATDEEVSKYSDNIANALRGLQEGSEGLSTAVSENDVASMLGGLNLDNEVLRNETNIFLPFMEGMMQSLLSSEILMPSIKDLLNKYPEYLAKNGDKISPEDKERYEKQLELYKIIEGHLEQERPDDSATVKREKFKAVLDDMRKLQDFGQPPEEILKELGGDMMGLTAPFEEATPNSQCPMM